MMNSLNIPALRGVLGNIIYYTATFTFEQVVKYVKPIDDELHTSESLKEQLQRALTHNYQSICDYILTQKEHFFNALVLAVYEGEPIWNEIEIEFQNENYYNMGFLKFNGKEKIFPVDGQHRVEGIKAAIQAKPQLRDESITVILIGHHNDSLGMQKTRRIFSTLNRYAKPVSLGDLIALDEDDVVAIVTREMLESFSLFTEDKVKASKKSKALADTDFKSFTTLITLYETNKIIFKYYISQKKHLKTLISAKKLSEELKFRPQQTDIEDFANYLLSFWNLFCEHMSGMKDYALSKEKDAAKMFRNKEIGGCLYFRPVALPELIRAIMETHRRTNVDLSQCISSFSQIDMCISHAPWVNVLWDVQRQTMITSKARLVYLLLLWLDGTLTMTSSEQNTLVQQFKLVNGLTDEDAERQLQVVKRANHENL